ncbi:hypothetical protein CMI37_15760 [Candidatus Pacearchaeota archaeon]|nr:hypothetical protein [Candidatus Pacearchaeota archaeon]|tara:strand:+ start:336 stop:677 length:342 start_codon:yes stop_codon:yes gene_type:complete
MSILDRLIEQKLGALTSPEEDPLVTQIETTLTRFLPNNPNRLAFSFTNLGATAIFILPGEDVATTKGFRIGPSGGTIFFEWEEDYHLVSRDWFGIAVSGASACYTQEQIALGG